MENKMIIAKFKKDGGSICAEVKSGFAQPGSYTLYLWEANSKKVVMERKGNFINTDDDKYEMPLPNEVNDQRIIDVFVTLVITPPIIDWYVELEVTQDGNVIGEDHAGGQSSQKTETSKLLVKLVKED